MKFKNGGTGIWVRLIRGGASVKHRRRIPRIQGPRAMLLQWIVPSVHVLLQHVGKRQVKCRVLEVAEGDGFRVQLATYFKNIVHFSQKCGNALKAGKSFHVQILFSCFKLIEHVIVYILEHLIQCIKKNMYFMSITPRIHQLSSHIFL